MHCFNELNCQYNQLTSLDVSNCTALIELDCRYNQLTSLDVSNNTALEELNCVNNQLISLDLTNTDALNSLNCGDNQLTSLDVSDNTALTSLSCYRNQLISLDVSGNALLRTLGCSSNQLTSLDLSNSGALTYLYCDGNQFTNLDVSNNRVLATLLLGDMPTLFGVCVWTMPFPPAGVYVDTGGSPNLEFTDECADFIVTIPDKAFLYALIEEGVDKNGDSLIIYSEADVISSLNISGNGITDLTGIRAFDNLDSLNCQSNDLSRLDVIKNTALVYLDCSNNQIAELHIDHITALIYLDCSSNQIGKLNVDRNTDLSYLDCSNNQLSGLDISENSALAWLDLSQMPALYELCVWTMPFPPIGIDIDTTASPNVYFTTLCECDGDYFEDNDFLSEAALIFEKYLFIEIFLSPIMMMIGMNYASPARMCQFL